MLDMMSSQRSVALTLDVGWAAQGGGGHLLREQHSGCEVVSEAENLRNLVVPVQELGVDVEEVTAAKRSAWRV